MFSVRTKIEKFFLPALSGAMFLSIQLNPSVARSQELRTVRVDAARADTAPAAANYEPGASVSPAGHTLGLNSRYLTRDGKPWLPVMGEFHFSRYPRAQWEEELLKMKASGVDIVAAYVIWIHHEEIQGQFDWSGQRDLRAFAELCAKHGLLLEPRIGPWAHAEVRNGGLPDWVVKKGSTRKNDPVYLAEVRRFYAEIGQQLRGMMWKDGGPVVGVQLENEYSARGPGAGEEHILTLRKMAIYAGLDVPYYFVTGWDNAVVPEPAVLPVYGGGYPDAPWDGSIAKLPPPEVYAFRFHSRVASNMGAIEANGDSATRSTAGEQVPYLTAEIGGGIEDTYHRRPAIQADDIGAMFPVMLGSGVNLYGTYMFHGGQNPDGKLTTLQESQATGYINDLPIKSYDFQAPIGEFGQERASLGKMRLYQYFLNSFGAQLAPMGVHAPDLQPKNPADLSVLRAAVRSSGNSGFLFCNNYVRNYAMPARQAVQFEVRLPGASLRIPARPVDIPSGAYFIWPFHFALDGADLIYSTAQVFTRIKSGDADTYYFAAVRGIEPEFAFNASLLRSVQASSGAVQTESGVTFVRGIQPGANASIDLTTQSGARAHLVVLSAGEAEHAWIVRLDGAQRLLITSADLAIASDGSLRLRSRGDHRFAFTLTPSPAHAPSASAPLRQTAAGSQSASFAAELPEIAPVADLKLLKPAREVPPVKLGPLNGRTNAVAQEPPDGELPDAGTWSIAVPPVNPASLSDLFLDIRYTGDIARLYAGDKLLDDDFFNGIDWSLGLKRLLDLRQGGTLQLSILPLRQDAPVYFESPRKLEFDSNGQAVRVEKVRLTPEYVLSLGTSVP